MTERGLPQYRQVADKILEKIASGELASGFRVPDVATDFRVPLWRVRKAAEYLSEHGVIEPHQGSGYTVLISPEQAAAEQVDDRSMREQLAGLQREVAGLRQQVSEMGGQSELAARVGRIEANLIALYGQLNREYPRGGRRERGTASAAARR